jgi:hypothetical protein
MQQTLQLLEDNKRIVGKDVIEMFCFNADSKKGHNHLSTISIEE